ncbi:uncharacterized protein [Rutidosis leptorrhynchoides]|uniref:uncharacterized protein n=1 Tax=Rutidosis leptorrhynchoides TaxID=125765 RepID=UPI003A996DB5
MGYLYKKRKERVLNEIRGTTSFDIQFKSINSLLQAIPTKLASPSRNKETVEVNNSFEVLNQADNETSAEFNKEYHVYPERVLRDEESDIDGNDTEPINLGKKNSEGASTPVVRLLMNSFATWNIRGLNRIPKQKEIRDVVAGNNLCFCAILESHVDVSKLSNICASVFRNWQWTSNNAMSNGGTRIIMGWNPVIINVMVIDSSDQVMHCLFDLMRENKRVYVSIVYAKNYYIHRRSLWDNLCMHSSFVGNHPWVIMGDFNVSLNLDDSTAGSSNVTIAMREFRECVDHMRMIDVSHSGLHYTWNQRPNALDGILKKIDRVMANDVFINEYTNAYAVFLPYRISDHCPAVLKIPSTYVARAKPFKFSNFIVYKEGFDDIIRRVLMICE